MYWLIVKCRNDFSEYRSWIVRANKKPQGAVSGHPNKVFVQWQKDCLDRIFR